MNDKQYIKCFYNKETNATYKTLKAAKESSKNPVVKRCWMLDGEIKAMHQLFSYGDSLCTIKDADKAIAEAIEKGTVSKTNLCSKESVL